MQGSRFRRSERAALISLGVTVCLVLLKFAVWAATDSLVVLTQAFDSLLDIVALGLVFLGVRLANKPADETHHYGHAKAENLAAFTQTLLIGVVVVGISFESINRLAGTTPEVSAPWYALALLFFSIAVDAGRVVFLLRTAAAEGSDALKAGALNIAGDVGTAVVALGSLALIRNGMEEADPFGSLLVGLLVAIAALRLGKRSVDILMDRAPTAKVAEIERAASEAVGVREMRRIRVRSTGEQLFADVTIATQRTNSLEHAHEIAERVEAAIEEVAPGTDVVVHVEPATEASGLVERVQAAASRVDDLHEIHNISVHAFDDEGRRRLHVTLHAKVAGSTSLKDAHDVADRIEDAIVGELGAEVRVDAHIEPLETTSFARDVTTERPDVAAAVQEIAIAEPDVLDCHEVLVTLTGSTLAVIAHVTGRANLALSKMHDASERIENALHARFPELGDVLIHFEPR